MEACPSSDLPQPPLHAQSLAPAFGLVCEIRRNDSDQQPPHLTHHPRGLAPTDLGFLGLQRHCFLIKLNFSVSKTRKNERTGLRKVFGSRVYYKTTF